MPLYLYDALYPTGIPVTIESDALVASYVDHPEVHPPCMQQLADRFPNHRRITIAAHGGDADIGDVERGAMTPTDLVWWLPRQRGRGITPAVYAAPVTWPDIVTVLGNNGIPLPLWWAVKRGPESIRVAGSFANQFAGVGPYDKSIIYGPWPGITELPLNPNHDPEAPTMDQPFTVIAVANMADPRDGECWVVRVGWGLRIPAGRIDLLNYYKGKPYCAGVVYVATGQELNDTLEMYGVDHSAPTPLSAPQPPG